MNQATGRTADQIARGLAYVCEYRKHLETIIAGRPAAQRAALTRLTDPAGSAEVAVDLETVHKALRSAGDGKGIFGQEGVRSLIHPVGVDQDDSEPVLRCPRLRHPCTRFAQPNLGTNPSCDLTGKPLARGDLRL
jgi:hypothetical protein